MTKLTELEALLAKATPLPWEYGRHQTILSPTGYVVTSGEGGDTEPYWCGKDEDIELLLLARNIAPKLIAVARAAAAFIHAEEHEGPLRSAIGAREIAVALAALEEP